MPRRNSLFRKFINSQLWLARQFDRLLPEKLATPGYRDSKTTMLQKYLARGITLYDFGSGSRPSLNLRRKTELGVEVVGIDIDQNELNAAPEGLYDRTICADLTNYEGEGLADLVICMAVLEHVRDNNAAIHAISSALKPGGKALLYLPAGGALFARLNKVLPEGIKRKILHGLYPSDHTGFPAYYDRCTPEQIETLARQHDLGVVEKKIYYTSHYFAFFFPFYLCWRLWNVLAYLVVGERAAESFSLVLEKSETTA